MLVASQPDLDVLLETTSGEQCLREMRKLRQTGTVAVVGVSSEGDRDSFWLIRSIRDLFPSMPIIATGTDCDDVTISRALFVGADSFVDKDTAPAEFADAIRRTGHGEVVLAGIPNDWLGRIARKMERPPEDSVLTPRELEVLETASQGQTARQIAARLGLRERTVTTHLGRIYKKLGAGGRLESVVLATRAVILTRGRGR